MKVKMPVLVLVFVSIFITHASADGNRSGFLQRETLTGKWGGSRDRLAEKGITLDFEFTEYFQGMFSGTGYDDTDFGGRVDGHVYLDIEKLGLWKGGSFNTHLTYRFGDLPAFRGGALWPVTTGSILPLDKKDNLVATSLYLSQRFGNRTGMLVGKINAVDLLAGDPFFGGWGNHRFMNLALVAPPSGVVPPVIMGAVFNYRMAPYTLTFMVFDPHDRTGDYWPERIFSDGVNLSFGITWGGELSGRKTSLGFSGTYSTEEQKDLSEILLPPDLQTGVKDGSYNISVSFSRLLLESSTHQGQGLGVYGRAALADGNPNPIEASFSGGLAGHRMIPGRPNDIFGAGYFYYNFSKDLRSAVLPLLWFGYEQGIEVFYSMAVTPWFRISADIQWVNPADRSKDNAWIGGLRANLKL